MLKRLMAVMAITLLLAGAPPVALAAETYSAHTPLSGSDSDKLNNLRLAAQAIDGAEILAGDTFSFNEMVGPLEKRRGFRKAINGRGALVTGGGVAQAASTLYMALLQLGDAVEIDPVKTYGSRFSDDYVQNPSLAIVTDYDAGIDLSFTNLGEDLVIDMWLGEDDLWCVVSQDERGFGLPNSQEARNTASALQAGESGDSLSFLDFYADDAEEATDGPFRSRGDGDTLLPSSQLYMIQAADAAKGHLGAVSLYCGGDRDVVHNVTLAANCLSDTVLDSGDAFSFNDVVGPRTKKYGYRRALNGRGAKVTGGGVAQVASALWLAVKDSGCVDILEKSTYGSRYNQRYVDDAADAILTDYASGKDFRFRYTGDSSLTIYAYVDDGWLYCDVYED